MAFLLAHTWPYLTRGKIQSYVHSDWSENVLCRLLNDCQTVLNLEKNYSAETNNVFITISYKVDLQESM